MFCWFFLIIGLETQAQVLPVGTHLLEDKYRRDQLLGHIDSTVSFTIRPLTAAALQRQNVFAKWDSTKSKSVVYVTPDEQGYVQLMPASLMLQTNTAYPYGWSDGAMIPARGLQRKLTAGVFAQYKFLTVQFQPEYVSADNLDYHELAATPGYGHHWYITFGNRMDMPEFFGKRKYTRVGLGQSSIRLNFEPVSIGWSTENLWWGPGIRNSLLMGNTAPGFPHFTINTVRPVETPIGTFETQLVGGFLKRSGFPPSYTEESRHHEMYYIEKPETGRYFSGFVITYQPKFLSGLSLGLIRSFVVNRTDMNRNVRDYLPFFSPTVKETTYLHPEYGTVQTTDEVRDRYGSVFFRWAMPAGKFEAYGEYGRKSRPENGRDWMVQPSYSRAFVLGFRKLVSFPLTGAEDLLQFDAEVTEMAFNRTNFQKEAPTWYAHNVVRDGYTHKGQVLGAGIGPGSNVQSVDISWVRQIKQVGIRFERFVHKEDMMYREHYVNDLRRGWVDLGVGVFASWDYKNLLVSAKVQYMYSNNYRYQIYFPPEHTFWGFEPRDKKNYHLQFGLSYIF